MKKCRHAKDQRDHCWVQVCSNNRLEHWPYKAGSKRPANVHKPHDLGPINAVHRAAANKEEA